MPLRHLGLRVAHPLDVDLDPDELLSVYIRRDHHDQVLAPLRFGIAIPKDAILPGVPGLQPRAVGGQLQVRVLRKLRRRRPVVEAMPQGRVVGRGGRGDDSQGREPSDEPLEAAVIEELLPDHEPAHERIGKAILAAAFALVHLDEFLGPTLEGGGIEEELPPNHEALVIGRPVARIGGGLSPAAGHPEGLGGPG